MDVFMRRTPERWVDLPTYVFFHQKSPCTAKRREQENHDVSPGCVHVTHPGALGRPVHVFFRQNHRTPRSEVVTGARETLERVHAAQPCAAGGSVRSSKTPGGSWACCRPSPPLRKRPCSSPGCRRRSRRRRTVPASSASCPPSRWRRTGCCSCQRHRRRGGR